MTRGGLYGCFVFCDDGRHTFSHCNPPNVRRQLSDAWEAPDREMQVLFYRMLGELFDALPVLHSA
jgi:hypothetical protein